MNIFIKKIKYLAVFIVAIFLISNFFVPAVLADDYGLETTRDATKLPKSNTDISVIEIGASYLKIIMFGILFVVPSNVYSSVFYGAGDTRPPMIISLIANWLIKLPLAIIGAYILRLHIEIIWWAIVASILFEAIFLFIWYKRGHWKATIV